MSLSRSPSPAPGGGWAVPGLNLNNSGRSSPSKGFSGSNSPVMWETSRMRHTSRGGYPSFSTQNQGYFMRNYRKLSSSLPRFIPNSGGPTTEKDKEIVVPSRWALPNWPLVRRGKAIYNRMSRKLRLRLLIGFLIFLSIYIFYHSPLIYKWRRSPSLGGGKKFVIILGANVGGGVTEWKGAREWAIERDSTRNKKKFANRWGYELEIVDMSLKKRYAHEWRESWEKVDFLRTSLRKYPDAEWFWWLDLNTLVMEPSYSLQSHIFDRLNDVVYRDINAYNPLNITHPPTDPYLDELSRSPVGDGKPESVNLILSQDCSGFNLGSFFVRRSVWLDRLLDVWWDPVAYEQKHMDWAHKEQDALEQLYVAQPWIRQHTAFLPQRMINSFPEGACSEGGNNTRYHYNEADRDFLVNMAGCEWGRDCWGEMYKFRELSYYLNRSWWERFKEDFLALIWYYLTGQRVKF